MKKLLFSDVFEVDKNVLKREGLVNISLLCDLPLFLDPFLIYGSEKEEYKKLNSEINKYILFLKNKAINYPLTDELLDRWFLFHEVNNNWLGYCKFGNRGLGLGKRFANNLYINLRDKLSDYGDNKILEVPHIEKLGLIDEKIGSDNISDFVMNIIKHYFLEITEEFAHKHLREEFCKEFSVEKAYFDYDLEKWVSKTYYLPSYNDDYIILMPKDVLTKDYSFLNTKDLLSRFSLVIGKIPDTKLKGEVNNYLESIYREGMTKEDENNVKMATIREFPSIIDYYIKEAETNFKSACKLSRDKVNYVGNTLANLANKIINELASTNFYQLSNLTYEDGLKKVSLIKDLFQHTDISRYFFRGDVSKIKREEDLELIFRLVFYGVVSSIDSETINIKKSINKSLIEFKIASNPKLKQNLKHQLEDRELITVIFYFNDREKVKLQKLITSLDLVDSESIIVIDARKKKYYKI